MVGYTYLCNQSVCLAGTLVCFMESVIQFAITCLARLIGQYLDVASKLLLDAEEPEVFLGFLFQGCFLCLSHFTVFKITALCMSFTETYPHLEIGTETRCGLWLCSMHCCSLGYYVPELSGVIVVGMHCAI